MSLPVAARSTYASTAALGNHVGASSMRQMIDCTNPNLRPCHTGLNALYGISAPEPLPELFEIGTQSRNRHTAGREARILAAIPPMNLVVLSVEYRRIGNFLQEGSATATAAMVLIMALQIAIYVYMQADLPTIVAQLYIPAGSHLYCTSIYPLRGSVTFKSVSAAY